MLESTSVDDDLAQMRKEMSGSSLVCVIIWARTYNDFQAKNLSSFDCSQLPYFCSVHSTYMALISCHLQKGELPPGRASKSGSPFRDTEIEYELNELRKKAKEY